MDQTQPTRRRGRPPKDGTAMDGATRQKRYMERLLTGKAVAPAGLVDTDVPDLAWYRARLDTLTTALLAAQDRITNLESDRKRLEARAYEAEARMRDAERKEGLTLNEKIVLKKRIAELEAKPARPRRRT